MDGRWKKLVAGAFLAGVVGCGTTKNTIQTPSGGTGEPPLASRDREEKGPPKASTLLTLAQTHIDSAQLPQHSERDRERLYSDAKKIYQQILEREPKNVDAMLGMAQAYKGLQDKPHCAEWYQKALKVKPDSAPIWGEMGQSLDALQDRDAAINCYHTATKLDPSNKDYKKALGFALARAGRYDEGYAWLSRCMKEADAHVMIARMMDHNGQHDEAKEHFMAALKIDPANEVARLAVTNQSAPSYERVPDFGAAQTIQAVRYDQPLPATPGDGYVTGASPYSAVPPVSIERPETNRPAPNASRLTPPPPQGWIQSR